MTTTTLDQSPYRPGVYGSGQCRGAAEMTALALPTAGAPKVRERGAQPQDGATEHLCPACLSEPPTGVGTLVFLGARCRAVLRVARAHGIDGADVLRDRREMWLPIVGMEQRYEISSRGRVRSVKTGRILKTPATGPFYPMVELDGRTYRVHILQALTFLGPRPSGMLALHWNDRKTDMRIANIRYGTHRENYQDAIRNGSRPFGRTLTGAQR
jgi:hypothetical protein